MFKKSMTACAILLCSSSLAFTGTPYLGASFGATHQTFEDKTTYADGTFDAADTGVLFNTNLGYGGLLNSKLYLGGEILANVSSTNMEGIKIDDDIKSLSLDFKTKYTYGLSVLPGYMLTDMTMAFVRLGYVRTRFDVKETYNIKPIDLLPSEDSEQNTVNGGQFGLGMQTKLTDNLDLRGEYNYSSYHTFHSLDNKIDPSSGQATVGLVYKFK